MYKYIIRGNDLMRMLTKLLSSQDLQISEHTTDLNRPVNE